VVAPHADDEVLGCGGLLAKLAAQRRATHILYVAVDGFHHYGIEGTTTFPQRIAEIETVSELLGCTYEICYPDKGLIEKLDTLPKLELVDLFEAAFNKHRPELLLLPCGVDYDQDHVVVFQTAFAAARPIAQVFGKWLVPHVFTYEMTKLNWAAEPLPRPVAYCDIGNYLSTKLDALRRYASQFRASPHIRSVESVTSLASIRGKEVGIAYAEAFGVLRTLM
jgi:LmbE family N-acetylglucosaminyl deacetylase